MSDAPPEVRADHLAEHGRSAGLTPDVIDRVIADFRVWLQDIASGTRHGAEATSSSHPIDLHTLVAQFTALRHEVNLQTKATRAAVEQNARLVDSRPADDSLRPLVTAVVEIADALTTAYRQLDKARVGTEPLLADLAAAPACRPGFIARLFGTERVTNGTARRAADHLRPVLASVADGYALSLRRVERALVDFGLQAIECIGRPFDPDTMEVVELGEGGPHGTVLEEVRRGYRWNNSVFRFAQVKVAR